MPYNGYRPYPARYPANRGAPTGRDGQIFLMKNLGLTVLFIFLINISIYAYDKPVVQRYLDQGNYEEAIKLLKEAVKINPNDSSSYISLGNAYIKLHRRHAKLS